MKNSWKISILFLFLVCKTLGQDYYFKHYDADDGLSRNTVVSTLLSKKGFLWVGTKDGLNRFDGDSFKVFRNDPDNPESLGSNYIESLHEHNGKLWVGTDIGLYVYDDLTNSFQLISTSSSGLIHDIEHDDSGNIWYISGHTLFRYELYTQKTVVYDTKTFSYAEELARGKNGDIWVAYESMLFHYNSAGDTFEAFEIHENISHDIPFKISKLFALDENSILLGTENHGAVAFDIPSHKTKVLLNDNMNKLFVRDFVLKGESDLWIATESGLYIYNLTNGAIQHLKKDLGNPYSLSDNAIYSITLDNEGGIWLGTYFGGLNYYPEHQIRFKKYFPQLNSNSISGNAVREIRSDKFENLWIGTEDGGLNKLNLKTGKFTNYLPQEGGKGLSHYNIHALLAKGDSLWIGTFEHGLDVMDIKTGTIIKHFGKGERHDIGSNFILSIYESEKEGLLAATSSGIHVYDTLTDSFVPYEALPTAGFFTSVLEDGDGNLWAGSFGSGLFKYNTVSKKRVVYRKTDSKLADIGSKLINGIYQDSSKKMWFCTEDGLFLYQKDSDDFKKYGAKQGFPSNVFYAILEDEKNQFWISTSKGLVSFNPTSETTQTYTKSHGLLSDQFNYSSAYKSPDGTLFFGSIGGMISFEPDKIRSSNTYVPPLIMTDLQVNTRQASNNLKGSPFTISILSKSKVVLEPDEASFSVKFASLSYTAPETTEYWYKLQDNNEDWIYLQNSPVVNFTALPPDTYFLSIKSKNIHGIISELESPLEITLKPTFWRSNLAFIIYAALLLTLGYGIFNYFNFKARAKNYRTITELKNKRDREIFKAKVEFFTNVSHEIRTPLTLIKTPLEKLLSRDNNDEDLEDNLAIMEKNTSRLLDLTNQLLDFRQAEMDNTSLTFVNTNISELIRKTYLQFSQAITDNSMIATLNLEEEDVFAYVDEEIMRKVISNLLSNALKYGNKHISINLKSNPDFFELYVMNDGLLIPSHLREKIFEPFYRGKKSEDMSHSGTGIGLTLARSLSELHSGRLYLDTSKAEVNCFVLYIPIHQDKEVNLYQPPSNHLNSEEPLSSEMEIITNTKSIVLVVEDNLDLLDFISKDLSDEYTVLKAMNANQAIEIVNLEPVNIIVSDVMMPGMDGFEFCEMIKSNIKTSHIPIILLTAKGGLSSKLTGLEHGVDAYINKPFSMGHLRAQMANLLQNRTKIIEHFSSSPLAHIRSMAHSKTDETFIEKLNTLITENISNQELNVDSLAENMNMSRSTFYRKIKDLSNLNPNELVNLARLKKAAELLASGEYKMYEIAERVGYKSQSSFGRNFQKQFHMTPTEYMKENS